MLHIANPVAFVCFFQDAVVAEGANHAVQVAVACPYGIGNIGHDIPEKGVVCGGDCGESGGEDFYGKEKECAGLTVALVVDIMELYCGVCCQERGRFRF